MIFPSIDNFEDFSAINVFITYKINAENPVTTILAYVYGNSNMCYQSKKKKLSCCLPVYINGLFPMSVQITSQLLKKHSNGRVFLLNYIME